VTECKEVFRLKLGADPPANVKPLVIKLRDGAESVRMLARKYAPPQLKFMRDKIHELEELGLVYKNTGAEWASPPLILPKPGPDQYRMTVDLRVPNASTKPTAWPMPNLQGDLRSAIPNYSNRVDPLQAALDKVFKGKSRRTKKAAAAVSLLHLWGPEEPAAFKELQAAIMDSMTLVFPDPEKRICVLTDASDRFYAGLVTQIDEEQLDLPMEEQDYQPLALLSGEFKGAQLRWTIPKKEGFAIVDTVTKMDYLLLSRYEFSILSDHLNLTYIYNPLSADPL
jgi:RNase H-like domain found in reverse transcriptase